MIIDGPWYSVLVVSNHVLTKVTVSLESMDLRQHLKNFLSKSRLLTDKKVKIPSRCWAVPESRWDVASRPRSRGAISPHRSPSRPLLSCPPRSDPLSTVSEFPSAVGYPRFFRLMPPWASLSPPSPLRCEAMWVGDGSPVGQRLPPSRAEPAGETFAGGGHTRPDFSQNSYRRFFLSLRGFLSVLSTKKWRIILEDFSFKFGGFLHVALWHSSLQKTLRQP